ncbi:hypothetical protein [Butyrivibrio sp. VCB2006]|uniref:hypothetical protein n=1 Tax=Butyrivibrio sp. VCB2006 TaxID=1280679 RepID=UPI000492CD26|nr:hypothetical protein [Butyrivibrio sp. VCB2006]
MEEKMTFEDVYNEARSLIKSNPFEIRDAVVKELIKPMLKEHGFTTGGNTWCRKLSDGEKLVIHMDGNRFNNILSGASFGFRISLYDGRNGAKPQYGIGEMKLDSNFFLPYYGMCSPLYDIDGYNIGGFRDGMPVEMPVEEIKKYIRNDFEEYILQELLKVDSREDYKEMYSRFCQEKRFEDLDVRIAWFIRDVQSSFTSYRADGREYEELIKSKKSLKVTKEEILSNLDLADKMRCNLNDTSIDAKPLLMQLAEEE